MFTAQAPIKRGVFTLKAIAKVIEIDALSLAQHDRPALTSLNVEGWRVQSEENAQNNGLIKFQKIKESKSKLTKSTFRDQNSV